MKQKLSIEERKLRHAASQAKYRATHSEKLKSDRAKWYAENPTYNSAYYANNEKKIKLATTIYAKTNTEQTRANKEAWRKANLSKVRDSNRAWEKANPEKVKLYQRTSRIKNLKKRQIKEAAYRLANPGKRCALQARRDANKLLATPSWANLDAIKAIYIKASILGLEVDHIIPLQGKNVCGLHVENNLQLLSKSENSKKSNSHTP